MKNLTLQVRGRERTFRSEQLVAILEEYFLTKQNERGVAQVPTEGKWFEVKPFTIDRNLFQDEKENVFQESGRQLILEAFDELSKNPKRYGMSFKTMFPKRTWLIKNFEDLKEEASLHGDGMTDWAEQAMEWAQRIANGESWEDVFNTPDAANNQRMIVWKNGCGRLVGEARNQNSFLKFPATYVGKEDYFDSKVSAAVPSVVWHEH